ncbi:hypothetical protein KVR01_002364 [Diaporthe batatas]|uniref:uncharacterized protein n=1 Tax=Diaporthe batatas TaxID=748121 RepID=UPI001D040C75|nr:uncharacterized protein KVR01_002364 [Diaporthe batatas]KAG8166675.1 hypothetical protein KVR01_002364 [Diaporthe batatas]
MAAKLSLLSLCAILATAPIGSCQVSEEIMSETDSVGYFEILSEPIDAKDDANATGIINLDGYNLTIAVVADLPIPNSTNTTMATVISLEMEPALTNLTTCISVFQSLSANTTAAAIGLESQDGYGCGSILTDECVSDFELAVSQTIVEDCSNSMPSIPDSCRDQFGDVTVNSALSIESADEQIIWQDGSIPAPPGNETLWLAAATNIWPVFVTPVMVGNNGSTFTAVTSLSCLRPDTFKEGTVRPSAAPNGTESGGAGPTGTGTTAGATPSPTNAASQAGLTAAAVVLGLIFNAAMLFM